MKKKLFFIVMIFLSAYIFAGGNQESVSIGESELDVVKIENFYHSSEYTKVPERVVALSLQQVETLSALGLEEKIILANYGHNYIEELLPEYRSGIKDKPVIEEPNLEYIISQNPDLIFMASYYFFISTFGKYEDYEQNNINLYVAEGTYEQNSTIQNTYNDILNLARIFRIEDKANKLIKKLSEREEAIVKKLSGVKPVKCFIFDSESKGKIVTAGGIGLENYLLETAGGKNIFEHTEKQFLSVPIEEIIAADPDFIIINSYPVSEGGQHYDNDGQRKIDILKNKKELSEVSAIKNNRFIIVPLHSVFPGIQNIDALENIARGLHPEVFN